MTAVRQSLGTQPVSSDFLNTIATGTEISALKGLISLGDMLSSPGALSGLKFLNLTAMEAAST